MKHWPDRICDATIRYADAGNYRGFYLADTEHGIPTFGAVTETGVRVFNYPGQTEDIARRLVACWNACVGKSIEELEQAALLTSSQDQGEKK